MAAPSQSLHLPPDAQVKVSPVERGKDNDTVHICNVDNIGNLEKVSLIDEFQILDSRHSLNVHLAKYVLILWGRRGAVVLKNEFHGTSHPWSLFREIGRVCESRLEHGKSVQ